MPTVHEHDVHQQMAERDVGLHHAAAKLDHRDLVAELANPGKRLDEHIGLLNGALLTDAGQMLAPKSSLPGLVHS
jgi:hypothetical protein